MREAKPMLTLDAIQALADWSVPQPDAADDSGRSGRLVSTAVPTSAFWAAWKRNRFAMGLLGIRLVRQDDDTWLAIWRRLTPREVRHLAKQHRIVHCLPNRKQMAGVKYGRTCRSNRDEVLPPLPPFDPAKYNKSYKNHPSWRRAFGRMNGRPPPKGNNLMKESEKTIAPEIV